MTAYLATDAQQGEETSCADAVAPAQPPWRPIQYLGSKLRSLDPILDAVFTLGDVSTVWDPFSGSSVVSQALARHGRRVVAGDTQRAAAILAQAMLGVGRNDAESQQATVNRLLGAVEDASDDDAIPYSSWVAEEDSALARGDAATLLDVGRRVPQEWRSAPSADTDKSGAPRGLLSATFAGTYFGIRQSVRLDALRAAVATLRAAGQIACWDEAALLTALCHAASAAVFSAGKHFAQPLTASNAGTQFLHKRLLQDRRVDVDQRFRAALMTVVRLAQPAAAGHSVYQEDVLRIGATDLKSRHVDVAYLDPPYTAQQYSRFYHVLETLVTGEAAPLQRRGTGVTKGLYPTGRYMSPFCSKRQALPALRSVIETCAAARSSIVVSYSFSQGSDTGNQRMVSLDDLTNLLRESYGRRAVAVRELEHTYRRFNSSASAVVGGQDREFLLTADAR